MGYPRKAEQVGRDSGALRAPLSRLKLVPPLCMGQEILPIAVIFPIARRKNCP